MTTRERRILLGVCIDCESKELETKCRCAGCNLAQRLYQAGLRAERKKRGRCTDCGERKRVDRALCDECQAYYCEWKQAKAERKQDERDRVCNNA